MQQKLDLNQAASEIWERIQAHSFEIEGERLSFTARLARENRWSTTYTLEVIEEYRRFCLLAVVAEHPVTPSEDVDQVWHLHLTYTQDYWEEFCPNVLKAKFHHGPTKGGKLEANKFNDWYENTLESYTNLFGMPPSNIWPEVSLRFSNPGARVFINQANAFIFSKRLVKKNMAFVGIASAALITRNVVADTDTGEGYSLFWFMGILVIGLITAIVLAVKHQSKANHGGKNNSDSGAGGASGSDSSCNGASGCGGGCGGCGG